MAAYQEVLPCRGGLIATIADLEALRYCQAVNGSLSIQINDPAADFSALYDVSVIQGMIEFDASN